MYYECFCNDKIWLVIFQNVSYNNTSFGKTKSNSHFDLSKHFILHNIKSGKVKYYYSLHILMKYYFNNVII